MCTFFFRYENNIEHKFEHIKRVEYLVYPNPGYIIVNEQELLTYHFPTKHDLHLFSDNANFTVSGNNLVYIEVRKEK